MVNAKPQMMPDTPDGDRPTVNQVDIGLGRAARHCATGLATLAGSLAIANLWLLPVTEQALLSAGRGVILLLLAIGLMGTARLSLFLTLLVALTGTLMTTGTDNGSSLQSILEICLLGSTAVALLCPKRTP